MEVTQGYFVNKVIDEIVRLVRDLRIPVDVASFSELHDYIDANELGGFCDDKILDQINDHFGGRGSDGDCHEGAVDFMSACQNGVDAWLKDGNLRKEDGLTHFTEVAAVIRSEAQWRRLAGELLHKLATNDDYLEGFGFDLVMKARRMLKERTR